MNDRTERDEAIEKAYDDATTLEQFKRWNDDLLARALNQRDGCPPGSLARATWEGMAHAHDLCAEKIRAILASVEQQYVATMQRLQPYVGAEDAGKLYADVIIRLAKAEKNALGERDEWRARAEKAEQAGFKDGGFTRADFEKELKATQALLAEARLGRDALRTEVASLRGNACKAEAPATCTAEPDDDEPDDADALQAALDLITHLLNRRNSYGEGLAL